MSHKAPVFSHQSGTVALCGDFLSAILVFLCRLRSLEVLLRDQNGTYFGLGVQMKRLWMIL